MMWMMVMWLLVPNQLQPLLDGNYYNYNWYQIIEAATQKITDQCDAKEMFCHYWHYLSTNKNSEIIAIIFGWLFRSSHITHKSSKLHGECASYWLVVVIIGRKTLMGKLIWKKNPKTYNMAIE